MKIISSSLLLFFIIPKGFAQEKAVTGSVKNEKMEAVEFANIIVNSASAPGNTVTYCISDEQGNFSFKIKANAGPVKMTVSAIGYIELAVMFLPDTLKTLQLLMKPDSQLLKEVIVTAKKEGDTLKLGIDSMNLTGESTLRDILNKTAGMMVAKDGSISYNGKQIVKVLLNGKEVFINQNKVALDNLNYEMMDEVQVLNNYKDRFNIDFNTLSTPVINIKTKARFKGVLKFTAEAGAGYKNAYKVKGKAFFFSDNMNAFLTSATNNISEKDFSFKDISAQLVDNGSVFFKNTLLPFFVEDNLLEKDFNSNHSLTLRKQNTHSKMGAVINFAGNRTVRNSVTTVSTADTIVKQGTYTGTQRGSLLAAVLNYSYLFKRQTVLNNNAAVAFVSQTANSENNAVNFNPLPVITNESNNNRPVIYSIANNTKLTSLLSKKILMNATLDYFTEQTKTDFSSLLSGFATDDIRQQIVLRRHVLNLSTDIAWKYSGSFSLRAGAGYTLTKEKGTIAFPSKSTPQKSIRRDLSNYNIMMGLQGQGKKTEYSAYFTPVFFDLQQDANAGRIYSKVAASFTYKPTYRENIIFRYNRGTSLSDLNSSYDTIVQSYNFKIFNAPFNRYNISRDNKAEAGLYHSNAGKSRSLYVTYVYDDNRDFIQLVFDTIVNNVFYFRNQVVDRRQKHTVGTGGSKAFYLEPRYHKLEFSGGVSYSNEKFPAITGDRVQQSRNRVWQGNVQAGLQLQTFVVKDIKLGVKGFFQQLALDGVEINRQSVYTAYVSMAGNTANMEWKLALEDAYYRIPSATFHIPNFDVLLRYKATPKLSFALAGKALFNLLNITANNNSSVYTFSNGNLVTQIINTSRIGYLLLNTIYKF